MHAPQYARTWQEVCKYSQYVCQRASVHYVRAYTIGMCTRGYGYNILLAYILCIILCVMCCALYVMQYKQNYMANTE
jgi:hypothetical protein